MLPLLSLLNEIIVCGTINVLNIIFSALQMNAECYSTRKPQSVLHVSARLRIRLAKMIDSYRIRHSCTGDGTWNLMFIISMCVYCLNTV